MTDNASSGSGRQRVVQVPLPDIQAVPPRGIECGYQPQVSCPVNLALLKPPRGGSAMERPEKPATSK
jgi:hypothetical protein